ncbi:interferon regulatory factor 8-like isoform X4 [Coregonus clupeaformis]|uniref:interferon regulatory factor 8-like isoform X4 n=1 Tax=Coregonus clupeaformis TaxID=59861 RepID=UPI001E1C7523|nr:interferon regulatory factor 8-like isoform X4 [Coregonus clupeaformis]
MKGWSETECLGSATPDWHGHSSNNECSVLFPSVRSPSLTQRPCHHQLPQTVPPSTASTPAVQMSVNPGGRRLKQWLVEQIQSGQYPGLLWEDDSRTMFRIPWKHAGKQDYNQEVDASIFKAWAVFKGKFKEGEKAEPATWKTRLRCALNKSPDFEEVGDRSQLDISEPYKVYRIVPEEEQKTGKSAAAALTSSSGDITDMDCSSADLEELIKEVKQSSSDEYLGIIKRSHSPQEDGCRMQPSPEYWSQGSVSVFPGHQDPSPMGSFNAAFSQMIINFFYGGKLMDSVVTSHADGCRISPGQPPLVQHRSPYGLPDSLQNVRFPPAELIEAERQRHVTRKLLGHLERGVLVRANREGIFIKRLCQSRVFWSRAGGLGPHYSPGGPCKLERDAVVKIFDTGRFFQALQLYQEGQLPAPDPMVTLCFGEELHDLSTAKSKLIIVQITPVYCQKLAD